MRLQDLKDDLAATPEKRTYDTDRVARRVVTLIEWARTNPNGVMHLGNVAEFLLADGADLEVK